MDRVGYHMNERQRALFGPCAASAVGTVPVYLEIIRSLEHSDTMTMALTEQATEVEVRKLVDAHDVYVVDVRNMRASGWYVRAIPKVVGDVK